MSVPDSSSLVLTRVEEGVRVITFNRPAQLNAIDSALLQAIHAALQAATVDDDTRVLVLTGAGRAFCSGADLTEMARRDRNGADRTSSQQSFEGVLACLESLNKPVIAAANGLGVGFGFTLLGYCDFAFIAASARFRAPFSQLGLSPEAASSYLFPLRMGWANAARALMLGDWFSAQDVVAAGLAQHVVADEQLLATAMDFARRLAQCPLQSLQATKMLMMHAHRQTLAEVRRLEGQTLQRLIGTPANIEALKAFAARRSG